MQNCLDEVVVRHVVGEPVDGGAAALHASEPGHLALGELVDSGLKLGEHLVVGQLPYYVKGDEFVFQTIVNKVFWFYPTLNESAHLVNHAGIEASLQSLGDATATTLTVDTDAYYNDIGERMRLGLRLKLRIVVVIHGNLDGSYGSFAGVDIAVVAQRLVALQYLGEFIEAFGAQLLTQFTILGHWRQLYAFHHALDIHPRAATQDYGLAAAGDVIVAHLIIAQELIEIVFVASLADINHVVRHVTVLVEVLASAEVHATVELARVGADDFAAYRLGKRHRLASLSRCRWTSDDNHFRKWWKENGGTEEVEQEATEDQRSSFHVPLSSHEVLI